MKLHNNILHHICYSVSPPFLVKNLIFDPQFTHLFRDFWLDIFSYPNFYLLCIVTSLFSKILEKSTIGSWLLCYYTWNHLVRPAICRRKVIISLTIVPVSQSFSNFSTMHIYIMWKPAEFYLDLAIVILKVKIFILVLSDQ